MHCWTFFVLIGNGRRVIVNQVRADDLESAILKWAQIVEIEDVWITDEGRMTAWNLPPGVEEEFGPFRHDLKGIWRCECTFGVWRDEDFPLEWGREYPDVWVIKTDAGDDTPGLFAD